MTENRVIGGASMQNKRKVGNIFSLIKKSCLSNRAFLRKNCALGSVCFYPSLWFPSVLGTWYPYTTPWISRVPTRLDQSIILFLVSPFLTIEIWPPILTS